jgi:hypothetical protein
VIAISLSNRGTRWCLCIPGKLLLSVTSFSFEFNSIRFSGRTDPSNMGSHTQEISQAHEYLEVFGYPFQLFPILGCISCPIACFITCWGCSPLDLSAVLFMHSQNCQVSSQNIGRLSSLDQQTSATLLLYNEEGRAAGCAFPRYV